jgi:hypothetical protein
MGTPKNVQFLFIHETWFDFPISRRRISNLDREINKTSYGYSAKQSEIVVIPEKKTQIIAAGCSGIIMIWRGLVRHLGAGTFQVNPKFLCC